jgi:hypothetical protein
MNKIQSAIFAGVCLAAASSSAHASVNLSDSFELNQSRTYTVTFGPEVTDVNDVAPYLWVTGHGHVGRYIDYPPPTGRAFDISFDVFVDLICTSTPCSKGQDSGAGAVTLKAFTSNNQMIITVTNRYAGYDHCTDTFVSQCAFLVHSPMVFSTGFKFNGEVTDYTFTTTENAVPEPATWAMMIAGFGLVGATLRRKAAAAV